MPHWRQFPEDTKNEFRHAMKLVGEGVPAHEAMREAQVYIEQRRRIDEAMAHRTTA